MQRMDRPGDKLNKALAHPLCCAVLVVAHLGLGVSAGIRTGMTGDEPVHLATGYLAWTVGEFRMDTIHPPLARMLLSWPLLLQDVRPPAVVSESLHGGEYWPVFRDWVQVDHQLPGMLRWPRILNQFITAGVIILVWGSLRRKTPIGAAVMGAAMAWSPNLLAHGGLATTDASFILLYTAGTLAFWRLTERISVGRILLAGVVIGAALCCKFSAILFVPLCVILAALKAFMSGGVEWVIGSRRVINDRPLKAAVLAAAVAAVALQSYVIIWASYHFRFSGGPADSSLISGGDGAPNEFHVDAWGVLKDRQDFGLKVLYFLRDNHLVPEGYLHGLVTVLYRESERPSYLFWEDWIGGRWYFFPVAMLLKTPVSFLVILTFGFIFGIRTIRETGGAWRSDDRIWALGIAGALFAAATLSSDINIGLRHFLPIYPILAILAGVAVASWARRAIENRLFLGVAVLWQLGVAIYIWPDYLCYFNILVRPENGYEYLVDSNLDWGQDLPKVAEYAKKNDIDSIKLAYFGSMYASSLGLKAEWIPNSSRDVIQQKTEATLEPGVYVISATIHQGVYWWYTRIWWPKQESDYRELIEEFTRQKAEMAPDRLQLLKDLCFHRLITHIKRRGPDEQIGYTMFLYRVDMEEFMRAVDFDRIMELNKPEYQVYRLDDSAALDAQ
jgi:hypothetical protein